MDVCGLCRKQITAGKRSVQRPCCQGQLHEDCFKGYLSYAQSSGSGVSCPICKRNDTSSFESASSFPVFNSMAQPEAYENTIEAENPADLLFLFNGLLASGTGDVTSDDDRSQVDSDDERGGASRMSMSALKERVVELTELLTIEQKTRAASEQEVTRLTLLVQETQERNRNLREGYEQFQNDVATSMNSLKLVHAEELSKQLQGLEVRHVMHVTEISQSYEETIAQSKIDLDAALRESEQLRAQIKDLVAEVDSSKGTLEKALALKQQEIDDMSPEIRHLKSQMESFADLEKLAEQKQADIDALQADNSRLRAEIDQMTASHQATAEDMDEKQKVIDLLRAQLTRQEGLDDVLDQKEANICQLTQEILSLRSELEQRKSELAASNPESDLMTVVEAKDAEIQSLRAQNEEFRANLQNLTTQLETANDVNQQYQVEIVHLKEDIFNNETEKSSEASASLLRQEALQQELKNFKELFDHSQKHDAIEKASSGQSEIVAKSQHDQFPVNVLAPKQAPLSPIHAVKVWDDEDSFFGGFNDSEEHVEEHSNGTSLSNVSSPFVVVPTEEDERQSGHSNDVSSKYFGESPSLEAKKEHSLHNEALIEEGTRPIEELSRHVYEDSPVSSLVDSMDSSSVDTQSVNAATGSLGDEPNLSNLQPESESEKQATLTELREQLKAQSEYIERLSEQQYDLESQVSVLQEQQEESKKELDQLRLALIEKENQLRLSNQDTASSSTTQTTQVSHQTAEMTDFFSEQPNGPAFGLAAEASNDFPNTPATPRSAAQLEAASFASQIRASLEEQVAEMQKRWEEQADETALRQAELQFLKGQNTELQSQLDVLRASPPKLTSEIERLQSEIDLLKKSNASLENNQDENRDQHDELLACRSRIVSLEKQLEDNTSELKQLQLELSELRLQNATLRQALDDRERSAAEQLEASVAETFQLRSDIQALQTEQSGTQHALVAQSEETENVKKQLSESNQQIEALQIESERLANQNSVLRIALDTQSDEPQDDVADLKRRLEQCTEEISNLQTTLELLRSENTGLQQQKDDLEQVRVSMADQTAVLRLQLEEVSSQHVALQGQSTATLCAAEEQVQALTVELSQARQQLEALKIDHAQLQQQLKLSADAEESTSLRTRVQSLLDEISTLRDDNTVLQETIATQTKNLNDYAEQLKTSSHELQQLQEVHAELSVKNAALQENLDLHNAALDSERLERELSAANNQISILQGELTGVLAERDQAQLQLRELTKQLELRDCGLQQGGSALLSSQIELELEQLKQQLATLQTVCDTQAHELEVLRATRKDLPDSDIRGEFARTVVSFQKAKTLCANLKKQCEELTDTRTTLERTLEQEQESAQQKEEQLMELRKRCAEATATITSLEPKLAEKVYEPSQSNQEKSRERGGLEQLPTAESDPEATIRENEAETKDVLRETIIHLKAELAALKEHQLQGLAPTAANGADLTESDLKQKLAKAMDGFKKAKSLCEARTKQCKELTEAKLQLEQELSISRESEKGSLAYIQQLDERVLELTDRSETSVTAAAQLQAEVERLRNACLEAQSDVSTAEDAVAELTARLESSASELSQIREELAGVNLQCSSLQTELQARALAATQMQQDLESLLTQNAELRNTVDSQAVEIEKYKVTEVADSDLKEKLRKAVEGFQKAKATCAALKKQCEELREAKVNLEKQLQDQQEEQVTALSQRHDIHQADRAQLSQRITRLEEQLEQQALLQAQRGVSVPPVVQPSVEPADLRGKLAKATENFKKAKALCSSLTEARNKLTQELELSAELASQREAELRTASANALQLQTTLTALTQQYEVLQAHSKTQADEVEAIRQSELTLKEKLKRIAEDFAKAKKLCANLNKQRQDITDAKLAQEKELQSTNQTLLQQQVQINDLQQSLDASIKAKAQLEQELSTSLERTHQVEQQIRQLQQSLEANTQEATQRLKECEIEAQKRGGVTENEVAELRQQIEIKNAQLEKYSSELLALKVELDGVRQLLDDKDAQLEKYAGEHFASEVELEELRERVRALAAQEQAPVAQVPVPAESPLESVKMHLQALAATGEVDEAKLVCAEFLGCLPLPEVPVAVGGVSGGISEQQLHQQLSEKNAAIAEVDQSIQTLCGEQFVYESELEDAKEDGHRPEDVTRLTALIEVAVRENQTLLAQRVALSDETEHIYRQLAQGGVLKEIGPNASKLAEKEEELVKLIMENVDLKRQLEDRETPSVPQAQPQQQLSKQDQDAQKRFIAELMKTHNEVQAQLEEELRSTSKTLEEKTEEFKRTLSVRQEEHARDLAELELVRSKLESLEASGGALTEACRDYQTKLGCSSEALKALKQAYSGLEAQCSESEAKREWAERLRDTLLAEHRAMMRENEALQSLRQVHSALVTKCEMYEARLQEQQLQKRANEEQKQPEEVTLSNSKGAEQVSVVEEPQASSQADKWASYEAHFQELQRQSDVQHSAMQQQQHNALEALRRANTELIERCEAYEAQLQEHDKCGENLQALRVANEALIAKCEAHETKLREQEEAIARAGEAMAPLREAYETLVAKCEQYESQLRDQHQQLLTQQAQVEQAKQQQPQVAASTEQREGEKLSDRVATDNQALNQKLADATLYAEQWRAAHSELEASRNALQQEMEIALAWERQEVQRLNELRANEGQPEANSRSTMPDDSAAVRFLRHIVQQQAKKLRLMGFDTTTDLVGTAAPPELEIWLSHLLKSLPPPATALPPPANPAPSLPPAREGSSYFFMSTVTLTFAAVLSAALT